MQSSYERMSPVKSVTAALLSVLHAIHNKYIVKKKSTSLYINSYNYFTIALILSAFIKHVINDVLLSPIAILPRATDCISSSSEDS